MGLIRECERRPRHDDELPCYDSWDHFIGDDGEYWATRYGSIATGVDFVREPLQLSEAGSSDEPQGCRVEVVVIDPEDDWTGCMIDEGRAESIEEAEGMAAEFREHLDAYVMRKRL